MAAARAGVEMVGVAMVGAGPAVAVRVAGGQEEEEEEAVRWGAGTVEASLEAAAVHVAYQQEPSVALRAEVPSEVRQGVAAVA